jgi:hypothetical protein
MIYYECSSTKHVFTEIDNDRSEMGKERYVMGGLQGPGPRGFWKITGLHWPPASTCWLLNQSNKNVNRPAR